MKKNLYFRSVFRRKNVIKEAILDLFLSTCCVPRLLLEVFIRTNMGERYFSFSTAIIATTVLAILPIGASVGFYFLSRYGFSREFDIFEFLLHDLTWYLFLAGFVGMCLDRRREIKRLPSVFDFGRYSLSTGNIHNGFLNYQPYGKRLSVRTIETVIEPGFFFVIGAGLWLLQQHVGILIVVCSVCYSISYLGAYHRGDNFVMDQIDEMIFNEEMTASFVDGLTPNETRGVNYYGRKPVDENMRRKVAENFVEDSEIAVAI